MLRAAISALVLIGAIAVALCSARDRAGGWNDGSRLATAESLVDRGTFAIDDSIFVRVPQDASPYPPEDAALRARGTLDKLLIGGRFYSDKSPLPSIYLAAVYAVLQITTGLKAAAEPAAFCYWMTVASAGLAYVVAVWFVFRTAIVIGLTPTAALLPAGSLGLATVALPYARQVNGHIMLLAVVGALQLGLLRLAHDDSRPGDDAAARWRRLVTIGLLTGMAYTIDLGVGPFVLVFTVALVVYRRPNRAAMGAFLIGALPPIAVHHVITLAIAGTLFPANTVAEYFNWPGSPFSPDTLTGVTRHTAAELAIYAVALLLGKRGFIGHNLPLFLAAGGVVLLLRARLREAPEVVWGGAWAAAAWLLYAYTSNNYSGACASIRWFVPFLAPAYLVLALLLREHPRTRLDLTLLSAWGFVLAVLMWRDGPWMQHLVPLYWPIQVAALASWAAARWRWPRDQAPESAAATRPPRSPAPAPLPRP